MLIQFALAIKLQTSTGFRAIQKIMSIYVMCLGISMKTPSHSTISLWTKKIGYYQLENKKPKRKTDDWIIILDESIEFGHDKLLVIYGIRNKQVDFGKALDYSDLTPLSIVSGDKWTGELIAGQIRKAESEHGKNNICRCRWWKRY
jgi:hypothetical protein